MALKRLLNCRFYLGFRVKGSEKGSYKGSVREGLRFRVPTIGHP